MTFNIDKKNQPPNSSCKTACQCECLKEHVINSSDNNSRNNLNKSDILEEAAIDSTHSKKSQQNNGQPVIGSKKCINKSQAFVADTTECLNKSQIPNVPKSTRRDCRKRLSEIDAANIESAIGSSESIEKPQVLDTEEPVVDIRRSLDISQISIVKVPSIRSSLIRARNLLSKSEIENDESAIGSRKSSDKSQILNIGESIFDTESFLTISEISNVEEPSIRLRKNYDVGAGVTSSRKLLSISEAENEIETDIPTANEPITQPIYCGCKKPLRKSKTANDVPVFSVRKSIDKSQELNVEEPAVNTRRFLSVSQISNIEEPSVHSSKEFGVNASITSSRKLLGKSELENDEAVLESRKSINRSTEETENEDGAKIHIIEESSTIYPEISNAKEFSFRSSKEQDLDTNVTSSKKILSKSEIEDEDGTKIQITEEVPIIYSKNSSKRSQEENVKETIADTSRSRDISQISNAKEPGLRSSKAHSMDTGVTSSKKLLGKSATQSVDEVEMSIIEESPIIYSRKSSKRSQEVDVRETIADTSRSRDISQISNAKEPGLRSSKAHSMDTRVTNSKKLLSKPATQSEDEVEMSIIEESPIIYSRKSSKRSQEVNIEETIADISRSRNGSQISNVNEPNLRSSKEQGMDISVTGSEKLKNLRMSETKNVDEPKTPMVHETDVISKSTGVNKSQISGDVDKLAVDSIKTSFKGSDQKVAASKTLVVEESSLSNNDINADADQSQIKTVDESDSQTIGKLRKIIEKLKQMLQECTKKLSEKYKGTQEKTLKDSKPETGSILSVTKPEKSLIADQDKYFKKYKEIIKAKNNAIVNLKNELDCVKSCLRDAKRRDQTNCEQLNNIKMQKEDMCNKMKDIIVQKKCTEYLLQDMKRARNELEEEIKQLNITVNLLQNQSANFEQVLEERNYLRRKLMESNAPQCQQNARIDDCYQQQPSPYDLARIREEQIRQQCYFNSLRWENEQQRLIIDQLQDEIRQLKEQFYYLTPKKLTSC